MTPEVVSGFNRPFTCLVAVLVCLQAGPLVSRSFQVQGLQERRRERPALPRTAAEAAHALERVREWRAAVEQHEPGQPDAPAIAVGTWPRRDLQFALADLRTLTGWVISRNRPRDRFNGRELTPALAQELLGLTGDELRRGDVNRVVKRGALLHADIAMLVPAASRQARVTATPPESGQPFSVSVFDGQHTGFDDRGLHWAIGRMLLDAVSPAPTRDETARLWYLAGSAHLQKEGDLAEAESHLAHALRLFSSDAVVQFHAGTLHETLASPRIQTAIASTVLPPDVSMAVASQSDEWRQAQILFQRAVDLDPAFAEARLRLGRVTGLLGRHDQAAAELRRVPGATDEPLLLYYADLFLGREEEVLGHLDAARACFARATARYPRAQSPRLAESALARRTGDIAGALAAMQVMLAWPAGEVTRDDPWWTYAVAQARGLDAMLVDLRRPFLSAGRQ